MKFATLFALVASASAIKLRHTAAPKQMKLTLVTGWECPSQEQFDEISGWVHHELTTGDKTITADEAEAGIKAFAKKHGIKITKKMEEEAIAAFEYTDTNNDNQLDVDEMTAVWEAHGEDMLEHCGLEANW